MSRGWTMIESSPENDDDSVKSNARKEMIEGLVKKWNKLHTAIERRSFLYDEDDRECECEDGCQCEDPNEKDCAKLEVIEETLAALGARMMRPYEHHNENERYMEYMENRYD